MVILYVKQHRVVPHELCLSVYFVSVCVLCGIAIRYLLVLMTVCVCHGHNGCREKEMEKEEHGGRLKGEDIMCCWKKELPRQVGRFVLRTGTEITFREKAIQENICILVCMYACEMLHKNKDQNTECLLFLVHQLLLCFF